jgi:hypothetical protein
MFRYFAEVHLPNFPAVDREWSTPHIVERGIQRKQAMNEIFSRVFHSSLSLKQNIDGVSSEFRRGK